MTIARKGDFVVAGDPDLQAVYIARCIQTSVHNANPYLRVLAVLRYPMQRAIMYADIANENRPIRPDEVCQLKVYRMANTDEVDRAQADGYETTRARALETEIASALKRPGTNPRELAILEAHRGSVYTQKKPNSIVRKSTTLLNTDGEKGI